MPPACDVIKLALIGCGGRAPARSPRPCAWEAGRSSSGRWPTFFPTRSGRCLALLHEGPRPRDDYEDHGSFGPEQVDVPRERRFVGLDGYRQAIESGADLVSSPRRPAFAGALRGGGRGRRHCSWRSPAVWTPPASAGSWKPTSWRAEGPEARVACSAGTARPTGKSSSAFSPAPSAGCNACRRTSTAAAVGPDRAGRASRRWSSRSAISSTSCGSGGDLIVEAHVA